MGSYISQFADMMPSTVILENVLTRDDYGKPATYGPPQVFKAHISTKLKRIASRTTPGADTVAAGTIWLSGVAFGVDADTRVTVAMGDGHPEPAKLVSWGSSDDETGPAFSVLYLAAL